MKAFALAIVGLVLTSGCYQGHVPSVVPFDGGPAVDAGHDPEMVSCPAEGSRCDDGDACTAGDRCRGGACVGRALRCDSPPSGCHRPAGTCSSGECVYLPADGTACDDGDVCTDGDVCDDGSCSGTPRICGEPPPSFCLDELTLRTYLGPGTCGAECDYRTRDLACPDGCRDGACECIETAWTSELADASGDVGRYTALAVDASGGVHIAYYEAPVTANLKYAHRRPGGGWSVTVVDGTGDVGGSPSIAIDPDGGVHIVYDDLTRGQLRYATKVPGGAWERSSIESEGDTWGGSLAIDGVGRVHVAFTQRTAGSSHRLRYAVGGSDGWTTRVIDDSGDVGLHASIGVSNRGDVHVVHLDRGNGSLAHAHLPPGGTWQLGQVDGSGSVDGGNALAVDASGELHVSYFHDSHELRYARRPERGTWHVEPVTAGGAARWNTSIGVDAWGGVHVVHDVVSADLQHTFREAGGEWETERVGSTGYLLSFLGGTALFVDPRGDVHVSHHDERNRTLRYTHRRYCP